MNTIDHAILIPKSPAFIWNKLGDVSNNPRWQMDCAAVSILTTTLKGQGMRWRYTNHNGRDYVIEITAWYEGLGYEYRIVDGAPYKDNRGRLRLQEIAEGTVVQWTFSYESSGLLGGLRNSLTQKRHIKTNMADSLRNLYRYIMEQAHDSFNPEARTVMRDAPDVDKRFSYQPRHPSTVTDKSEQQPSKSIPSIMDEPPIAEDDTRPRPSVMRAEELPAHSNQSIREPDFLANLPPVSEQPVARSSDRIAEEKPIPHQETSEEGLTPLVEFPAILPKTPDPTFLKTEEDIQATPLSLPPDQTEEMRRIADKEMDVVTRELDKVQLHEEAKADKLDTAQISVFELFGLVKPSETQEIKQIVLGENDESVNDDTRETKISRTGRMALRIELRHKLVPLRRR